MHKKTITDKFKNIYIYNEGHAPEGSSLTRMHHLISKTKKYVLTELHIHYRHTVGLINKIKYKRKIHYVHAQSFTKTLRILFFFNLQIVLLLFTLTLIKMFFWLDETIKSSRFYLTQYCFKLCKLSFTWVKLKLVWKLNLVNQTYMVFGTTNVATATCDLQQGCERLGGLYPSSSERPIFWHKGRPHFGP